MRNGNWLLGSAVGQGWEPAPGVGFEPDELFVSWLLALYILFALPLAARGEPTDVQTVTS